MTFIIMTSSTKVSGKAKKFGRYRNVAVVETDGKGTPAMISDRAKHVKRIVQHYGACSVGSTDKCQYSRALRDAAQLIVELQN